ncbi:hypothetical protein [Flagellimonas sp.]|uniref:hypothetical protein n=1 Tax=Flagellimonas sp. TaxID=2058762 RepID=UPI003BAB12C6
MKISFDFDSTLSEGFVQSIASSMQQGNNIFITTSRSRQYDNADLFQLAKYLSIPETNIRFTEHEDKYLFLNGFDMHFDDDSYEIDLINRKTKCKGILVGYKDFSIKRAVV